MNEHHTDSPFETTTLNSGAGVTAPPTAPGNPAPTVNVVQASAMLAQLVPAAIISGGVLVCGLLWMLSNGSSVMRVAGLCVLLTDIGVALWMRRLFQKRADATREVSTTQGAATDDIARMGQTLPASRKDERP